MTAAEIDTLMAFYQQGRKEGDFETGIQQALARMLVAPRFVFRTEEEPADASRPARPIASAMSSWRRACRSSSGAAFPTTSCWTWPARAGCAIRRRSNSRCGGCWPTARSDALIRNFAGQWLYLRELANVQTEAKNFDDNLRQSFRRETEMLFGTIVREDRSLLDLLDADYTFVDERLARHYGIPNVRGSHFRRVSLDRRQPAPRPARAGQHADGHLGRHAHVAGVARQMDSREPARRAAAGAAARRRDESDQDAGGAKPTTLRQRLEAHRANPVCASCHKIMDPMGFALENFDLVGAWREKDGRRADRFVRPAGRRHAAAAVPPTCDGALLSRSDAFMTTATEKLLTYALGRPRALRRHAGRARHRPARRGER